MNKNYLHFVGFLFCHLLSMTKTGNIPTSVYFATTGIDCLLQILNVYTAKMNGLRKYKNKKDNKIETL
jgi:hypothetical protein